jgi:hypothetical protein
VQRYRLLHSAFYSAHSRWNILFNVHLVSPDEYCCRNPKCDMSWATNLLSCCINKRKDSGRYYIFSSSNTTKYPGHGVKIKKKSTPERQRRTPKSARNEWDRPHLNSMGRNSMKISRFVHLKFLYTPVVQESK